MYYQGTAQVWGVGGGVIGAVVGAKDAVGAKDQIKAAMRRDQIDLGLIIREQLESELVTASVFPSIVPEGGDAEIRLEVLIFGFGQPHAFSGKLMPTLGVQGSLVRTNGTVLWKKYDYAAGQNQAFLHTLEEYLQNPQLIREAIIICAKIVSDRLVKDMKQE
jgi:hypothetical protein